MSSLFDFDLVHDGRPHVPRVGMIQRVGELIRDMGIESPAKRYVYHLAAATNAQEWLSIRSGSVDQFQFDSITCQIYIVYTRMWIARRKLESNVSAAGEEKPVQASIKSVPPIIRNHRGDKNRYAARLQDGIDICLH